MNYGFKLTEADVLFSWHRTAADAISRQQYERNIYGRDLHMSPVTKQEYLAARSRSEQEPI